MIFIIKRHMETIIVTLGMIFIIYQFDRLINAIREK